MRNRKTELDNLEKDLGLVGNQYNIALILFFVGYVSPISSFASVAVVTVAVADETSH
jgi:hypothetical protein